MTIFTLSNMLAGRHICLSSSAMHTYHHANVLIPTDRGYSFMTSKSSGMNNMVYQFIIGKQMLTLKTSNLVG
jgi:hypothetical protein